MKLLIAILLIVSLIVLAELIGLWRQRRRVQQALTELRNGFTARRTFIDEHEALQPIRPIDIDSDFFAEEELQAALHKAVGDWPNLQPAHRALDHRIAQQRHAYNVAASRLNERLSSLRGAVAAKILMVSQAPYYNGEEQAQSGKNTAHDAAD